MRELTIGEAARQAGVGIETIRFYERRGLIEQPRKPQGAGFRVYSHEQIKRIRFIRQAQQIGFSLHEIQDLLALRADPAADCSAVRIQAVAKLEHVRGKIEQLHRIGTALEALIASCPGRGPAKSCTILDALIDPDHAPHILADGPLPDAPPKRGRKIGRNEQRRSGVKSLSLKIEGMHCDGCAETAKALVERQPGVKTASVSFENKEARILYDPQTTDEARLIAAIQTPGYRVTGRS